MEGVQLEILELNKKLTALEAEIKQAVRKTEEAENAGNETALQRWVKKEEQLRDKEKLLLEEKNKLRDREERLQLAGKTWHFAVIAVILGR